MANALDDLIQSAQVSSLQALQGAYDLGTQSRPPVLSQVDVDTAVMNERSRILSVLAKEFAVEIFAVIEQAIVPQAAIPAVPVEPQPVDPVVPVV